VFIITEQLKTTKNALSILLKFQEMDGKLMIGEKKSKFEKLIPCIKGYNFINKKTQAERLLL
jgi:hypothetical protein